LTRCASIPESGMPSGGIAGPAAGMAVIIGV
jgi:hypothetical protein